MDIQSSILTLIYFNMRKLLIGILVGLIIGLAVNVQAYRIAKPQRITAFDENNLVILNDALEALWDVTNGRMVYDVVTSVPTKASDEGATKIYSSGGVYKIYIYLNDGWRTFSSD